MSFCSIIYDARGLERDQQQMFDNLKKVDYTNEVWTSTYPDLDLNPSVISYGTVSNNVIL